MIKRLRHRTTMVALVVAASSLGSACSSDTDGGSASSTRLDTTAGSVTTAAAEDGSVSQTTDTTASGSEQTSTSTPDSPTTVAPVTAAPGASAPAPAPAPETTAVTVARPTSATPPNPTAIQFVDVATVEKPVNLAFRPGDPALYVVSQSGFIVATRDGDPEGTRVLDISDEISTGGEQGLLGLAFSLDGQLAFVNYTNAKGDTEITEYGVDAEGVFDPSSKRVLLEIDQPYANHNGGQVRIDRDGYLYIGMGDGGAGGDPDRNALDLNELLGKLLRIDPTPDGDSPYSIPADNPFVAADSARPEIWSIGLRNPWRFSFDAATNDLWIADVGQGDWEEIDVAWADEGSGSGRSFGWSALEGTHRFNSDQSAEAAIPPFWEYNHGDGRCSVSGGARYRGTALADLYGYYVYADFCDSKVRALRVNDDRTPGDEVVLTDELGGISEVAQGPDGELYVLSLEEGAVFALRAA